MITLAKSLGYGTFKLYNEGENVLLHDGIRSTYPASPGLPNPPEEQRHPFTNQRIIAESLLVKVGAHTELITNRWR